MMMCSEIGSKFKEDGYCILKNILSKKEAAGIKEGASQRLRESNDYTMTPSEFLSFEAASNTILNDNIVSLLQSLIGDTFFLYPNFTIRNNLYIQWHTDDFFLESPLEKKISDFPEFFMCNIYLQNNNKKTGGGIDIVPKSHLLEMSKKVEFNEEGNFNYTTVNTEAGDLLIFDYRVLHRGTPAEINFYENRLAIQWTVSKSKDYSEKYLNYMMRRRKEKLHLSDHTEQRALRYFNDIPNIKYPLSFPNNLIKRFNKYGIECICL